ncbi:hypothetical protein [Pontiella agarivorans]|uniref:Uncharacterized protein n=1 Tax=Pontiella agarivorans TaxID=3038953 RepID=A0ABU5N1T3_9BACT|nr:hypothetical protein [Pontiella agarivorans]MDZ8120415.1 hypothetical protein [Pontiella agarivorans]
MNPTCRSENGPMTRGAACSSQLTEATTEDQKLYDHVQEVIYPAQCRAYGNTMGNRAPVPAF